MRDRAADSLCVQPELSAPAPKRKELPLHTALPRRFESATMQRHSPDPDSGQKPDSYDEAHYRALFRDAPYYSTGRNWCDYAPARSEEHTSELQSLMRISYAVFCLKKKKIRSTHSILLSVLPFSFHPIHIDSNQLSI